MEASCSGKARRSFRREGWRARQRGSKTGLQATGPAEAGPARPAIKRARKGDTDKKSRESGRPPVDIGFRRPPIAVSMAEEFLGILREVSMGEARLQRLRSM